MGNGLNFFKSDSRSPKIDPINAIKYQNNQGGVYGSTMSHGPDSAKQLTDGVEVKEPKKPKLKPPKTLKEHVEITVFTMSQEDCQWGIFDFSNTTIDPLNGKIVNVEDDEEEDRKKNSLLFEECEFQVKGTNYITR